MPSWRLRLCHLSWHQRLAALAAHFGLDFAAADLKTDPDSGELNFPEIDSGPMFARFDDVAGGALTAAMLDWLLVPAAPLV